MTITNKTIHIISASIIIGLIVMWRCERQNAIDFEIKKNRIENENRALIESNELSSKLIQKLIDKNKNLEHERDSINFIIDTMSATQLKDFWAEYKGYYLHNNK